MWRLNFHHRWKPLSRSAFHFHFRQKQELPVRHDSLWTWTSAIPYGQTSSLLNLSSNRIHLPHSKWSLLSGVWENPGTARLCPCVFSETAGPWRAKECDPGRQQDQRECCNDKQKALKSQEEEEVHLAKSLTHCSPMILFHRGKSALCRSPAQRKWHGSIPLSPKYQQINYNDKDRWLITGALPLASNLIYANLVANPNINGVS